MAGACGCTWQLGSCLCVLLSCALWLLTLCLNQHRVVVLVLAKAHHFASAHVAVVATVHTPACTFPPVLRPVANRLQLPPALAAPYLNFITVMLVDHGKVGPATQLLTMPSSAADEFSGLFRMLVEHEMLPHSTAAHPEYVSMLFGSSGCSSGSTVRSYNSFLSLSTGAPPGGAHGSLGVGGASAGAGGSTAAAAAAAAFRGRVSPSPPGSGAGGGVAGAAGVLPPGVSSKLWQQQQLSMQAQRHRHNRHSKQRRNSVGFLHISGSPAVVQQWATATGSSSMNMLAGRHSAGAVLEGDNVLSTLVGGTTAAAAAAAAAAATAAGSSSAAHASAPTAAAQQGRHRTRRASASEAVLTSGSNAVLEAAVSGDDSSSKTLTSIGSSSVGLGFDGARMLQLLPLLPPGPLADVDEASSLHPLPHHQASHAVASQQQQQQQPGGHRQHHHALSTSVATPSGTFTGFCSACSSGDLPKYPSYEAAAATAAAAAAGVAASAALMLLGDDEDAEQQSHDDSAVVGTTGSSSTTTPAPSAAAEDGRHPVGRQQQQQLRIQQVDTAEAEAAGGMEEDLYGPPRSPLAEPPEGRKSMSLDQCAVHVHNEVERAQRTRTRMSLDEGHSLVSSSSQLHLQSSSGDALPLAEGGTAAAGAAAVATGAQDVRCSSGNIVSGGRASMDASRAFVTTAAQSRPVAAAAAAQAAFGAAGPTKAAGADQLAAGDDAALGAAAAASSSAAVSGSLAAAAGGGGAAAMGDAAATAGEAAAVSKLMFGGRDLERRTTAEANMAAAFTTAWTCHMLELAADLQVLKIELIIGERTRGGCDGGIHSFLPRWFGTQGSDTYASMHRPLTRQDSARASACF